MNCLNTRKFDVSIYCLQKSLRRHGGALFVLIGTCIFAALPLLWLEISLVLPFVIVSIAALGVFCILGARDDCLCQQDDVNT